MIRNLQVQRYPEFGEKELNLQTQTSLRNVKRCKVKEMTIRKSVKIKLRIVNINISIISRNSGKKSKFNTRSQTPMIITAAERTRRIWPPQIFKGSSQRAAASPPYNLFRTLCFRERNFRTVISANSRFQGTAYLRPRLQDTQ